MHEIIKEYEKEYNQIKNNVKDFINLSNMDENMRLVLSLEVVDYEGRGKSKTDLYFSNNVDEINYYLDKSKYYLKNKYYYKLLEYNKYYKYLSKYYKTVLRADLYNKMVLNDELNQDIIDSIINEWNKKKYYYLINSFDDYIDKLNKYCYETMGSNAKDINHLKYEEIQYSLIDILYFFKIEDDDFFELLEEKYSSSHIYDKFNRQDFNIRFFANGKIKIYFKNKDVLDKFHCYKTIKDEELKIKFIDEWIKD